MTLRVSKDSVTLDEVSCSLMRQANIQVDARYPGESIMDCKVPPQLLRYEGAGEVFPKFDLVEIRKSGNPRIAEYTDDSFEVASKGTGFVSRNVDHSYLATTGKPEIKPGNPTGTPRPIQVMKRHGSTDLGALTNQVYWLSEAHVGSVSRSTRLPITTYHADRCAEHGREGYLLSGEVIEGVPYI